MFHKQSIFYKLVLYNLPVSILPFLIILTSVYMLTCVNFKNAERTSLQEKLDIYVQDINLEKNNAAQKSEYIAKNPELLKMLEEKNSTLDSQLHLIYQINDYIEIINNSDRNLITLYSANNTLLKSRFTEPPEALVDADEVRKKLNANNQMYFEEEAQTDAQGNAYFTLYRKIFTAEETILRVKVYIPHSENCFLTPKSEAYNDSNQYITVPITEDLLAVASLNTQKLTTQCLQFALIFIAVGLLFCGMIVYVTSLITKKTTAEINQFVTKLAESDPMELALPAPDKQTTGFELNIIQNAIKTLVQKINESKDTQYHTELEKKRLELDLLQSKIDPHILYNSLTTISHKAFKNKDQETFDIIENLVSYYRFVLAQGKEFTTISEELTLIQKYLLVNEISHSQKYHFTYTISEELKQLQIVHLILQPFVENAVVHGLAGKESPCQISLHCYRENQALCFRIHDNGYGIDEKTLADINSGCADAKGYGIKNTYDRICLYYGEQAEMKFHSKLGEFTEVTLKIPYF